MRLQIVTRHAELEDGVAAQAREKIERLGRHLDRPMDIQLVLSPDVAGRAGAGKRGAAGHSDPAEPSDAVADAPRRRTGRDELVSDKTAHAELIVTIPREKPFVATAIGESYMAAIDVVIDRMDRQLVRHKERLQDRKRESQ